MFRLLNDSAVNFRVDSFWQHTWIQGRTLYKNSRIPIARQSFRVVFICGYFSTTFLNVFDSGVSDCDLQPYYPFACIECNKRFATKASLSLHKKRHTNDCPFECEQCGRRYPIASELRKHLITHARKGMANGILLWSRTVFVVET